QPGRSRNSCHARLRLRHNKCPTPFRRISELQSLSQSHDFPIRSSPREIVNQGHRLASSGPRVLVWSVFARSRGCSASLALAQPLLLCHESASDLWQHSSPVAFVVCQQPMTALPLRCLAPKAFAVGSRELESLKQPAS